jgi:glycosyltransferase involved in cell wall biosynthesis
VSVEPSRAVRSAASRLRFAAERAWRRARDLASARLPFVAPRRRRVVVVGHSASPHVFGAERSLVDVLGATDPDAFDVTCVLPADDADYLAEVRRFVDDVVVFPYGWWTSARPVDPVAVERFARLFRRRRADLVHVNTVTLMDPLVAARRLGVPSVLHARELLAADPDLARTFRQEPAATVDRVVAAADWVVSNSDATHAALGKPRHGVRLHNQVDVDRFDVPNEVDGVLRVGIVSSNVAKKGVDAFAELAAGTARRGAPAEFLVFGPPTEETARLAARVATGELPRTLSFAGYVPDPLDALRRVNVVASLPRVPESFGRTIAEGMAARRPVVAFDHGAAGEIVRHGVDGFLVPPGEVERAVDHVVALASDPRRVAELGENGRARAVALFSPRVFEPQLDAIYRRVLCMPERRGPAASRRARSVASLTA